MSNFVCASTTSEAGPMFGGQLGLKLSPHIPIWWIDSYIAILLVDTNWLDVEFMIFLRQLNPGKRFITSDIQQQIIVPDSRLARNKKQIEMMKFGWLLRKNRGKKKRWVDFMQP